MGGGNAQKSATARQRNLEKNESSKVQNVLLQLYDDDFVANDEKLYKISLLECWWWIERERSSQWW